MMTASLATDDDCWLSSSGATPEETHEKTPEETHEKTPEETHEESHTLHVAIYLCIHLSICLSAYLSFGAAVTRSLYGCVD